VTVNSTSMPSVGQEGAGGFGVAVELLQGGLHQGVHLLGVAGSSSTSSGVTKPTPRPQSETASRSSGRMVSTSSGSRSMSRSRAKPMCSLIGTVTRTSIMPRWSSTPVGVMRGSRSS
jgi:hypothetical protein